MPKKTNKRERAAKQLTNLMEDHLSKFTPTEQKAMHSKFESRLATVRDSGAKTPSPLRSGTR